MADFNQSCHAARAQIQQIVQELEDAFPGTSVTLKRNPGQPVDLKAGSNLSYSTKAGVTVPLKLKK